MGADPPVLVTCNFGHNPELASDGAGFLSVQEVNERIRAVRIDDGGHLLDADWLDLGHRAMAACSFTRPPRSEADTTS